MLKLTCGEFDEFEEALYGVQGRYVLKSRQQRDWRLRVLDLGGVAVMAGREGAGTVYHGVGLSGYFNLFLPITGHDMTAVDGNRFNRRTVGWMIPGAMFHIDAARPASWMTIAMSCELVLRWAAAHEDEFDASLLKKNLVIRSAAGTTALSWLVRRLFRQELNAPEELHADAAQDAARRELLEAVFALLLPVESRQVLRPKGYVDYARVLRLALELIDSVSHAPLYTEDLCSATGASERTLRNIFNSHLGISPHRYLMGHRLRVIHAALKQAPPGETVTNVCARFGVWDLGRFARQYRDYFGVLPSTALRGALNKPES
ncbi:AraC family transcriptional regulator [Tahibacter harae]|uniref:Helix-turn-helix domain-containing protein n=1 Tax=Tahibacter harae TaxID=2963937 RepID=A0ABT1QQS5_9GAMM|nr:AraC family transcriptional regulator [Tahibacter harae]MCQ4164620.1 helix-turn-helix domain-containing protein [Tahibacter harae]